MKTHIFKYILASLAVVSFVGCTDDLDIQRQGAMDMDSFYKTDEQASEAITACYTKLDNMRMYDLTNGLSDDDWAGGANRGDMVSLEQINEYRFGVENSNIETAFQNQYNMVYDANLVINKVEPNTPAKRQYIAEAEFFRAWAYMNLVMFWGDVPLITTVNESGDYSVARTPKAEVWSQIETDLTTAINSGDMVEKKSLTDNETSIRITKQAAQALLGRAYLYEGKYQQAADVFQEVINSGKYALENCPVGDLFQAPKNYNNEVMVMVNTTNDPNEHTFEFGAIARNIRNDKFDGISGNWNSGAGSLYWIGFGYHNPSKSLYDAFIANGDAQGTRLGSTLKTTAEMCKDQNITYINGATTPGNESIWDWKFHLDRKSYVNGSFGGFYMNTPIIRYAEVLLNMAECQIQLKGEGAGDEYINMVRTRSGLAPKTNCTLDDLKLEKRCEFAMEGLRYFDILRWGDCPKLLADKGKHVPMLKRNSADDGGDMYIDYESVQYPDAGWKANKNKLLPIPQKELDVNPKMTQNPGW